MKKIVMLAFCLSTVSAFAQDSVLFTIAALKKGSAPETKNLMVSSTSDSECTFSDMTESVVVNEINTQYGQVELKPSKIYTGISGKLQYKPSGEKEELNVAIEYEWIDKNVLISKGRHMVNVKVGESITLPGANGVEVKMGAVPAKLP